MGTRGPAWCSATLRDFPEAGAGITRRGARRPDRTVTGMNLRLMFCAAVVPVVLVAAGCGSSARRAVRVPDVTLEPLDAAEDMLDAHSLHSRAVGGGAFGIVV